MIVYIRVLFWCSVGCVTVTCPVSRRQLDMTSSHSNHHHDTTSLESLSHPLGTVLAGSGATVSLYLMVVLYLLPGLVSSHPPYKLKRALQIYNTLQVIFSLYLVQLYGRYMYHYGIIVTRCGDHQAQIEVRESIWPYFVAKHLDLLDTVFFVLRKKSGQVTLLHVYHHGVMITWTWLHYFYHPNDQMVFVGFLNSSVHVLMYTYYFIASLGPRYSPYVWWKKHLTKVQLVQFIMVIVQMHFQYQMSPCPIPGLFHWFCLLNITMFFVLFLKFYFRSYQLKMDNKNGI